MLWLQQLSNKLGPHLYVLCGLFFKHICVDEKERDETKKIYRSCTEMLENSQTAIT